MTHESPLKPELTSHYKGYLRKQMDRIHFSFRQYTQDAKSHGVFSFIGRTYITLQINQQP